MMIQTEMNEYSRSFRPPPWLQIGLAPLRGLFSTWGWLGLASPLGSVVWKQHWQRCVILRCFTVWSDRMPRGAQRGLLKAGGTVRDGTRGYQSMGREGPTNVASGRCQTWVLQRRDRCTPGWHVLCILSICPTGQQSPRTPWMSRSRLPLHSHLPSTRRRRRVA